MALTGTPYIPETITVHLGAPDSPAGNVTLPFIDYIKNVASSEIYPTWPENALRANIYAQISFALNRIYTEWYRSRGYDFDITNSTAFDQAFVPNRDIYDNISRLVDSLFNSYVRRQGSVEPYFTQYCNGTTVQCEGLSQWGTVPLAEQGLVPFEILTTYYGDDIELVRDAPVRSPSPSYPGEPLRIGSSGGAVRSLQVRLNRISTDYPAIPKILP
ncbi:MAG: SpoIID/LytB domain-containing protein, partial [Clostridia bacterium]|nr:SpoIID/LytB domain-containing protein [Clostridia bacterium]